MSGQALSSNVSANELSEFSSCAHVQSTRNLDSKHCTPMLSRQAGKRNGGRNISQSPCQAGASSCSGFSPLQSSTPSHSASRNMTLADFVTPERRRGKRNGSRKTTPGSFSSPQCGSWASGISEKEITPLKSEQMISVAELSPSHSSSANDLDFADHFSTSSESSSAKSSSADPNKHKAHELSNGHQPSHRVELKEPVPISTNTQHNIVKPSRRITPTVVSPDSPWHSFKQQAVFTPQSPKKAQLVPTPGDFSEERQRLKEKKAQLMAPICQDVEAPSVCTPSKSSRMWAESEQCIEPEPSLVTHRDRLDSAAAIFSKLIAGK